MTQSSSFADAYKAQHPEYNPWSSQQKQQLANAYTAKNMPTPQMVAGGYSPPAPTFNPNADAGFVLGNAAINQQGANAQDNYYYNAFHLAQNSGLDSGGGLIGPGQAEYNPFSQAAALQRSYDIAKRGTTNSYAAAGQLYSGALKNQQDTNSYNFSNSSDALKRATLDAYHQNSVNLQSVKDAGQTQYANLVMQALQNFLTQQGG